MRSKRLKVSGRNKQGGRCVRVKGERKTNVIILWGYIAVLRKCGSRGDDDVKVIQWKYFVKRSVCIDAYVCL